MIVNSVACIETCLRKVIDFYIFFQRKYILSGSCKNWRPIGLNYEVFKIQERDIQFFNPFLLYF